MNRSSLGILILCNSILQKIDAIAGSMYGQIIVWRTITTSSYMMMIYFRILVYEIILRFAFQIQSV